MSITYTIAGASLIIFLVCIAFPFVMGFWSLFDHKKWSRDSNPSYEAEIIDSKIQEVQYLKNGKKYKTTIRFSDGFVFVTHKTNRSQSFLTYQISIDGNLAYSIQKKALEVHDKCVKKRLKSGKVVRSRPSYPKKELPLWIRWIKEPYRIVAILGSICSILLNVFIPSNQIHELLLMILLFPFVELGIILALNCFYEFSKPFLAYIPIAVLFGVFMILGKLNLLECATFIARLVPFMSTISLAILVKRIRKKQP